MANSDYEKLLRQLAKGGSTQTEIINAFMKGVNSDFAEGVITNDMLSGAHNIKLTNFNDKVGVIQKPESYIELPNNGYSSDLVPLAIKDFDDVLYFVSIDKTTLDADGYGVVELGTFPSADITGSLYTPIDSVVFSTTSYTPIGIDATNHIDFINPGDAYGYTVGATSYFAAKFKDIRYSAEQQPQLGYADPADALPTEADAGIEVTSVLRLTKETPGGQTKTQVHFNAIEITPNDGDTPIEFTLKDRYVTVDINVPYTGNYPTTSIFGIYDGSGWEGFTYGNNPSPMWIGNVGDSGNLIINTTFRINDMSESVASFDGTMDLAITDPQIILSPDDISGSGLSVTVTAQVLDEGNGKGVVITTAFDDLTYDEPIEQIAVEFLHGGGTAPANPYDYSWILQDNIDVNFDDNYALEPAKNEVSLFTLTAPADTITDKRRIKVVLDTAIPDGTVIVAANNSHNIYYSYGDTVFYIFSDSLHFDTQIPITIQTEAAFSYTITDTILEEKISGIPKVDLYQALPNFQEDPYDTSYLGDFRTAAFKYKLDTEVDIEIQPSYDGSVNIILAAEDTKPRIINSRQNFMQDEVEIIVREGGNLDNVYSENTIDKTLLIPTLGDMVPQLEFLKVDNDGELVNGGYKYYFKLKTADGFESNVVEESRLVSIHHGSTFGQANSSLDNSKTDKSVTFKLKNLTNKVYRYVSVYYTHMTGSTEITAKSFFKIDNDYEIDNYDECIIKHTGRENVVAVTFDQITAQLTPLISAKTLTQKNNRLLLGNIKIRKILDPVLSQAALNCYIDGIADLFTVKQKAIFGGSVDDNYANANNIYKYTSYFPEETYEFAINFMFNDGTVSEAYPIMGFDYLSGNSFDASKLGQDIGWLTSSQNSHGVVRMHKQDLEDNNLGLVNFVNTSIKVKTMTINTVEMVAMSSALKERGVTGYFVSRRARVPNILMNGLITNMATAPSQSFTSVGLATIMTGQHIGYGTEGSLAGNYIYFPIPTNVVPLSSESLMVQDKVDGGDGSITDGIAGNYFFDGLLYGPLDSGYYNTVTERYAFYSPDITSDTTRIAGMNLKDEFGVRLGKVLNSGQLAFKEAESVVVDSGNSTYLVYTVPPSGFLGLGSVSPNLITEGMQYVDEGFRAFGSKAFTGVLDKQAGYLTYVSMKSIEKYGEYSAAPLAGIYTSEPLDKITKSDQISFMDELNTSHGGTRYITGASFEWDNDYGIAGSAAKRDSSMEYVQFLLSGVSYSPYIGMKIPTSNEEATRLWSLIQDSGYYFTAFSTNADSVPDYRKIGATANIYTNNENAPWSTQTWIERYSVKSSEKYFAISKRYPIDFALDSNSVGDSLEESKLIGGDCYTGFYYQRIWRPLGIEGVPTANNPIAYAYEADMPVRDGVKITNSGYSIGFPVRSKFNFAIRARIDSDSFLSATGDSSSELATEEALYNESRTYCPSEPNEEDILGKRLAETNMINYGNVIETSILSFNQIDKNIPYSKVDYPNRVIISEVSVSGEFDNGYRNFRGLNFKDYDEDLGDIVVLTSGNLYTYIVYRNGVAIIEIQERTAISGEESANVYIEAAQALPPKSVVILTTMGSQHLKSIINTEGAVYGYDHSLGKIWMVSGNDKKLISDFRFNSAIDDIKKGGDIKNVITSYNSKNYNITFSFDYSDNTNVDDIAVVYDTINDLWYGTSSIFKFYEANIDKAMLSILKHNDIYRITEEVIDNHTQIVSPFINGKSYIGIDDTIYAQDSYIELVVKYDALYKFIFKTMEINGEAVPSKIDLFPEASPQFTIAPALSSVTGVESEFISMITPRFLINQGTGTKTTAFKFTRVVNSINLRPLSIGDFIIIKWTDTNSVEHKTAYRVADLIANDTGTEIEETITVDRELPVDAATFDVNIGWRMPLRTTLGNVRSGKTYINIPTKSIADILKNGPDRNIAPNRIRSDNTKPYGKWVKVRLWFNGIDPIYIESIISSTTLVY